MESKKKSHRELVLTATESTSLEHIASRLEPFTVMVSGERRVTISTSAAHSSSTGNKHLLPKDTDPDLVQEMKTSTQSELKEHFTSEEMLLGSVLDPRFEFFSSIRRSGVYQALITAAAQFQAAEEDIPEIPPAPRGRRHRVFWIIATQTAGTVLLLLLTQ